MSDVIEIIDKLRSNISNYYWSSKAPLGPFQLGLSGGSNVEFVFDPKETYIIRRCVQVDTNVFRTLGDLAFSKDTKEGMCIQALMHELASYLKKKDTSEYQEENYHELVAATEFFISLYFH